MNKYWEIIFFYNPITPTIFCIHGCVFQLYMLVYVVQLITTTPGNCVNISGNYLFILCIKKPLDMLAELSVLWCVVLRSQVAYPGQNALLPYSTVCLIQ